MATDAIRRTIQRLNGELTDTDKKLAAEMQRQAKAQSDAARAQQRVASARSDSTRNSAVRDVERYTKTANDSVSKGADLQKKRAGITEKLAREQSRLTPTLHD
jgi:hypothetical protein